MSKLWSGFFVAIFAALFVAPGAHASTVVYDFSTPSFPASGVTPFLNIAPNLGPASFLATFTANTSNYVLLTQTNLNPSFAGPILKSSCFCAQTLTIAFSAPIYTVSLDFSSVAAGFVLNLTSSAGTASSTSASFGSPFGNGGHLSFSSNTAFTSVELGTGIFAIDNLTLETSPVPEPSTIVSTGLGLLVFLLQLRRLTLLARF